MAVTEKLRYLIETDAKGAVRDLSKFGATAEAEMGRAGKASEKLAGQLTAIGVGATVAAAVGVVGLKKLADSASGVTEAQNKVNVVFGDSSEVITDFATDAAKSAGISKKAALDAAGGFGQMLKTSGVATDQAAEMSVKLVQLAGDLASFNNIDPSEALEKLRSGLAGEAEPLRTVGVLLSETRVKEEAYRLGLAQTGAVLTEQQKVQARYSLILKDTALAQDDFNRTSDSLANQQRTLSAEFENLKANLGAGVLPAFQAVFGAASDVLGAFSSLPPEMQKTIGTVAGVGVAFTGFSGIALLAVGQAIRMKDSFSGIAATAPKAATAIKLIGVAAAGLTALNILSELGSKSAGAIDEVTLATERLAKSQVATGPIADVLGEKFENLRSAILGVADQSLYDSIQEGAGKVQRALDPFSNKADDAKQLRDSIKNIDTVLEQMVNAGNADEAAAAFDFLKKTAIAQGVAVDTITAAFPKYTGAVEDAEKAARGAAASNKGVGQSAAGAVQPLYAEAAAANTAAAANRSLAESYFDSIDASLAAEGASLDLGDALTALTEKTDGGGGGGGASGATQTLTAAAIEATQKQYTYRDALVGVEDAARAVTDAQEGLADAQQAATDSAKALAEAQHNLDAILHGNNKNSKTAKDAAEDLDDARRAQEHAVLDLKDAEENLDEVRRDPKSDPKDIRRAELAVADARDRLEDATKDVHEAQRIYNGVLHGFPANSKEAQEATEDLQTAQENYETAIGNVEDAQRTLEGAMRSTQDAALTLKTAIADLRGELDAASGGGGSITKAKDSAQEAARKFLDAKNAVHDWAVKQAELSGAQENTKKYTDAFRGALEQLQAFIDPRSPLGQYVQSLIAGLDKIATTRTVSFTFSAAGNTFTVSAEGRVSGVPGGHPLLQHGGPARAGESYIVGEKGPELFTPNTSGVVIPNNKLGKGGRAVSGEGTSITIGNLTLPNVRDADDLVNDLVAWSRRNGPLPVKVA